MSKRLALLIGGCVLVCASPAAAQVQEAPRTFVGGLGGVTFGDQTSIVVAGQGGIPIGGGFHAIVEAGRMQNILPASLASDLEIVEALLGLGSDGEAQLDARLRASYATGGLRWSTTVGRVMPFVEASAGISRLGLAVDATVGGTDVSDQVEEGLRDDDFNASKFVWAAGGGVLMRLGSNWGVDLGYRYFRIHTEDPAVPVHAAYAAVKRFF